MAQVKRIKEEQFGTVAPEVKREESDRRNESMSFTLRSAERGDRCKECVKKVDSNALDAREILPSFFLWKEETQTSLTENL